MTVTFWMFVLVFAIMGAMRGWAKEIMVTFSVILALFILTLLQTYVPLLKPDSGMSPTARFWFQTIILLMLAFFGYQTPNIKALGSARFARERVQDALLGFIIGALNGYLIVGTIWYWMDAANYPFQPYFMPPDPDTPLGQAAISLLNKMPPTYLVPPWVYFAVAIAFFFVVVVFI
jgi:uncharacterized membrane protein required for colicin V production